jgi:hypothetical protein
MRLGTWVRVRTLIGWSVVGRSEALVDTELRRASNTQGMIHAVRGMIRRPVGGDVIGWGDDLWCGLGALLVEGWFKEVSHRRCRGRPGFQYTRYDPGSTRNDPRS